MNESASLPFWVRCGDTTASDWRNIKRLLWALLLWAICFAGGSQLLKRGLVEGGPAAWLVAVLPSLTGLLVIAAYARFVNQADELQRLIGRLHDFHALITEHPRQHPTDTFIIIHDQYAHHLARIIHKHCRVLACSFVRTGFPDGQMQNERGAPRF